MLREFGRRFGGAPGSEPSPPEPMDVPSPVLSVVAYTDQAVLRGQLPFDDDRLTDALNAAEAFVMTNVEAESLGDGSITKAPLVTVARDDLVAVEAAGPRGDPARRVRTQAQVVTIRSGPYVIDGRVHALAGADPVGSLRRRRPMVPLTMAHISFAAGGRPRSIVADLLIINRDLIDVIQGPHDQHVTPTTEPQPPATGRRSARGGPKPAPPDDRT